MPNNILDKITNFLRPESLKSWWGDTSSIDKSIFLARIGICLGLYFTWVRTEFSSEDVSRMLDPKGLLSIFPVLKDEVSLRLAAQVCTFSLVAALFGVHHIFFVIGVAANIILASAQYSFAPGWSHGLNVQFLAALPLIAVNTCRRSKTPNANVRTLALFVSLFLTTYMFGNAAMWKSWSGDHFLQWTTPTDAGPSIGEFEAS